MYMYIYTCTCTCIVVTKNSSCCFVSLSGSLFHFQDGIGTCGRSENDHQCMLPLYMLGYLHVYTCTCCTNVYIHVHVHACVCMHVHVRVFTELFLALDLLPSSVAIEPDIGGRSLQAVWEYPDHTGAA